MCLLLVLREPPLGHQAVFALETLWLQPFKQFPMTWTSKPNNSHHHHHLHHVLACADPTAGALHTLPEPRHRDPSTPFTPVYSHFRSKKKKQTSILGVEKDLQRRENIFEGARAYIRRVEEADAHLHLPCRFYLCEQLCF